MDLRLVSSDLLHLEAFLDHIFRARPYHHLEFTCLNHVLHLSIVETKMFRAEGELDSLCLARLQRNTLEAFQLFHWSSHAGGYVTNVELYNLIARALAHILHLDTNLELSIASDARVAKLKIRDLELCVAKAEAKWKLWRPR